MPQINWIAHRGLTKHATENTLPAFADAVSAGFDSLETDLRLTKDGHIVLCHDINFARIGGPKTPVWQMTRKEIAKIFLPGGAKALFLDQFIEKFSNKRFVFDIKSEGGTQTIRKLQAFFEKEGKIDWLTKKVRFLAWKKKHRILLSNINRNFQFYGNASECWRAGLFILMNLPIFSGVQKSFSYALPPFFMGINLYEKHFVEKYQAQDAKVLAYLPYTDTQTKLALAAGVDEILTDHDILNHSNTIT